MKKVLFDLESRLIKKIQKGNKEAANELIEKYYKEIYAYIYKQVTEKELAMDLTQEVFISMLKTIISFNESKSSFKTWLYKISTYKVIDYYRSKKYNQSTLTVNIDYFDIEDESDFQNEVELKETVSDIRNVIARLDVSAQEIFRLRFYNDYTFSEISKALNLNESTIKTKYYSMIKKIRKEMKDYE